MIEASRDRAEWYVARGGNVYGPVPQSDLLRRASAGDLTGNDLVWTTGLSDWTPAHRIPTIPIRRPVGMTSFQAVDHRQTHGSNENFWTATEGAPAAANDDADERSLKRLAKRFRPARSATRASFVRRHWRGDLSLTFSFWVVGVDLSVALVTASYLIGRLIADLNSPQLASGGLFILFCCLVVVSTWQLVGVWRSAGNAFRKTGRSFWPSLAGITLVLAMIPLFWIPIALNGPQVQMYIATFR